MTKHTALKLFLCGVIITISVFGQSRSFRRHSSKNDLCLKSLLASVTVDAHHGGCKNVPVANSSTTLQNSDGHFHTRFKNLIKFSGDILAHNNYAWAAAIAHTSKEGLQLAASFAVRPAYYTFLFRYTPF